MEPWTSAEWLTEAKAWIRGHGEPTAEIEQIHVRPWSTVLRVPTADGDLYFKAVAPVHAFEPALTALLAELQPGRVPDVLATDVERGWMLMRDGGTRIRELVQSAADLHHWEASLSEYARLQIETASHAEAMLAIGVPDERLSLLPRHLEELLALHPPGLTADEERRLAEALPRIEAMCRELAGLGIGETIQHDDLHDGNVFVREDGYRIFDWGDSAVMHPFASLVVAFTGIAHRFGLAENDPDIERLRQLYLERFAAYGEEDELREAAALARPLGMLSRADAWQRIASLLDEPGEMSENGCDWFRDFAAAVSA